MPNIGIVSDKDDRKGKQKICEIEDKDCVNNKIDTKKEILLMILQIL